MTTQKPGLRMVGIFLAAQRKQKVALQRQGRWRWLQEVELQSVEESKRLGHITGTVLGKLFEYALPEVQRVRP